MDEARAVLERLERIEEATGRDELLAELRELVREVEAWVRVERDGLTGISPDSQKARIPWPSPSFQ